jgi:L-aspartate oxidase
VVVATKRAPADANTAYAQGGVAGALDPDDTVATHVDDTLRVATASATATSSSCARARAPEHILWFAERAGRAVRSRRRGHLALGREGGHTARRIVHAEGQHRLGRSRRRCWRASRRAPDRITICPITWRSIC